MPIKRSDINKRMTKNNNKKKIEMYTVEERLFFLSKRVDELIDKLEYIERDLSRITFVVAIFSKYIQYHSDRNEHQIDGGVVRKALMSTNIELMKGYKEQPITPIEEEMIIAYLKKIEPKKRNEWSEAEKEKLR